MKKTSKILGSIALSAALAMGTAVPAFAATGNETNDLAAGEAGTAALEVDENKQAPVDAKDGVSTVIQASTYTSQLSVTIPLSVPLKFDTVGGEGLAPSNNAYYIKNNSSTNITVVKADYKVTDNEWDLADAAITDATAGQPVGNVAVGDFYLKIAPTVKLTGSDKAADLELKATGSDRTKGAANLNWGIKPTQQYGFALSPSSSKLKKTIDGTSNIASITYTVAVGAPTGAVFGEVEKNDDPSTPATTVTAAKAKAMNATGLEATFGATATYVNASGAAQDVSTGNWMVTAVKYNNLGSYQDYPNDAIMSGVAYQVTVTPAPAA